MTSEQFAYWMQGFAEINGAAPTEAQWSVIKDHLNAVFTKVTPNRVMDNPDRVQPTHDNPLGLKSVQDRLDLEKAIKDAQKTGNQPNPMMPKYGPLPEIIC